VPDIHPPTLEDVAAEAGVSTSTVSRVLSGKVRVSGVKAKAVHAAVKKLDYHPNPAARALANRQQSMIAIIVHNTVRYGYAKTIEGIGLAARKSGYSIMITVVESDSVEHIQRAVDLVMGQPIAGVILVDFDEISRKVLTKLPRTVRAVIAGGHLEDGGQIPRVYIDDTTAGYTATQYLLGLGHETVHLIRALSEAGAPIPSVIECDYDSSSGYSESSRLFAQENVTAVLCGNDEVALGVLSYAQDNNIRIPADVSIVSFDDQPFASVIRPALTTIQQDFVILGGAAFETLRRLVASEPVPLFSAYEGKLQIRQSATHVRTQSHAS
jgi:DNA-binding LacI/PurR family transcriptional regulator